MTHNNGSDNLRTKRICKILHIEIKKCYEWRLHCIIIMQV